MGILLSGIVLTAASWSIAWMRIDNLTEYSFFPLWLGYILVVNGTSEVLLQKSLLRRMGVRFLLLFGISIPLWWFFEGMNAIVKNWHYVFYRPISALQYFIQASVDFSTVIPAVLSTAVLLYHLIFKKIESHGYWLFSFRNGSRFFIVVVLIGLLSMALLPLFPRESFPLIWIAPLLLLEPVIYLSGYSSWLERIEQGDWSAAISMMFGALFTGFWWELWNYYSLPKWYYTVPYVDFWHIFEMPLLGYLGYLVFGLFVLSYSTAVVGLLTKDSMLKIMQDAG